MSDSTLSGRSAALRKLNRLTKTKLPKGHGELPENFKYVWLGFGATGESLAAITGSIFGDIGLKRDFVLIGSPRLCKGSELRRVFRVPRASCTRR
jgi:hypothetical protein